MSRRRRRRSPFGLRARVAFGFALVSLLVSVTLAVAVTWTAREYLLSRRESLAVAQASANARAVAGALRSPDVDVASVLAAVPATGRAAIVQVRGRWYSSSLTLGADALPADLQQRVLGGQPAMQRVAGPRGEPMLVVGLPVPRIGGAYFEVADLRELDRSIRTISATAAGGSVAVTLVAVLLGWWASGRVLRPVGQAARTATAITAGDLQLRLPTSGDADLDRLATSFNAMVDTLAARSARDARFASDVSHELRSPLTSLSTAVQVLQNRRDEMPERSRAALDLVATEVRRFEQLVVDLLEISRYDGGHRPELGPVVLADLVRHALAGRSPSVPTRIEPDAEGAVVAADKRRLEQVLANLVDNAACHAGGATEVAVEVDGDRARIVVEDRGPGVPPEDREVIFERFARGRAAGHRRGDTGVGLGLALVSEHVRLHDGRVWVEDGSGGGARFVVELPVERP